MRLSCPRLRCPPRLPPEERIRALMYERFTDNSRTVMQLANRNAQRLNHKYVGTEHILLGLAEHGTGVAVSVLKSMDINIDDIPSIVSTIVQKGPKYPPVFKRRLPHVPSAKKVVEFAMEEARSMGHRHVGTEHLLIGMLRVDEGVAAHVLARSRVELETVRNKIMEFPNSPQYSVRTGTSSRQANNAGYRFTLFVLVFVVIAVALLIVMALLSSTATG